MTLIRHCILLPGITLVTAFGCYPVANAAEIVAFRTTDVNGHIELDFTSSEIGNLSRSGSAQRFSILSENYVYHPKLLKLDLNASMLFSQESSDSNTASNDDSSDNYDLSAHARLLGGKPYPMSIYYTRSNPVSTYSSGETIAQKNTSYGFELDLLEPFLPLTMNFFISHDESSATSPTRIIDGITNKFGFEASKKYSDKDGYNININSTRAYSASGSLSLPIVSTQKNSEELSYNSQRFFGEQKQFKYSDNATVNQQEGIQKAAGISFSPSLIWQHSNRATSSYSYSHVTLTQNDIDASNRNAIASLSYFLNEKTDIGLSTQIEDSDTVFVDTKTVSTKANIAHRLLFANGHLKLKASLGYRQNDRVTTAFQANITGETLTLTGLLPIPLAWEYVVASSVVVQNLSRTQTYLEGIDYRIIVVGNRTEIQRLSGGNILDPEQVVVDYSYQTGGSAGYTTLDQSYSASLALGTYYGFLLSYQRSDPSLTSGSPTLALGALNIKSIEGNVDYPLSKRISVSAKINLTKSQENNYSYDSQIFSAYSQIYLPYSSSLRLSFSHSSSDSADSLGDRDLTDFSLRFKSTPRDRMMFSAEYRAEEGGDGILKWKGNQLNLNAQWLIRQLTMNAAVNFGNTRTGTVENKRWQMRVTIRRNF